MEKRADIAVIGAGIVGLAMAYACATRGKSVVLFDRNPEATGASIRNFGLLWPVGQPFGQAQDRALRSREIWLKIISEAGLWHSPTGSMHLAYHPLEMAVLEEFYQQAKPHGLGRSLLTPAQVQEKSSVTRAEGLLGGFWSPTEIMVDPRQAIRRIPDYLREKHRVELRLGSPVNQVSQSTVVSRNETWRADQIYVCSGADFETLYPEIFSQSGMTKSKLQMLRTAPQPPGWELGPSICGGLTLTHYDSFKSCLSLKELKEFFQREWPFCVENGIHVLISQTALGELTIGDSHHYGLNPDPFEKESINEEILRYLAIFARLPEIKIAERWHGVYPKLSGKTEFIHEPEPGVLIVNGLGGAGMTMSFGLADEIIGGR